MYPVQLMISYFTTSFTAIMHIGREVTAKQYTGGDLQDSKGTYIKKQAQEWVRLVSCRYKEGRVGIYCFFWHVCIRLLFPIIGYHLSAIQYGMTGA